MKNKSKIILLSIVAFTIVCCKKDAPTDNSKHLKITVLIKNLENPWGMAFLPNGDFLFCERIGNLNLIKKGANERHLLMYRSVVVYEGGLLGLAIDPDFNNNHFIYIY